MAKKCEVVYCGRRARFGAPGGDARSCEYHTRSGDQHIQLRRCRSTGCGVLASFGPRGSTRRRHCAAHKQPGEVSMCAKLCEADGCPKKASFGTPGTKTVHFCGGHRSEGDVNIERARRASRAAVLATGGAPS